MDKMCRVCGLNIGISYIFTANEELGVSAKIMYCCTKVSIVEGDGLPTNVCRDCEAEVEVAYRFVLKCEATDKRLRTEVCTLEEPKDIISKLNGTEPKVEVKDEDICSSDNENIYLNIPQINNTESELEKEVDVKSKHSKVKKLKTKKTRILNPKTPFPCPSCNKKYKDGVTLKRHIERLHYEGIRERNFICENCGKGFFTKNDVKIHMRIHTGETPYACTECPRKFTQNGALLRHRQRHAGEKPHTCPTCNKGFCTRNELKFHLLVHTDEKGYSCPICNAPFKYQNNLRKHMVRHSAPNSFLCLYCGRTFNQKGNLQGHLNRQHSEKSGYCNVCSKNVPDIEAHTWRHTGERPLKCQFCASSFFEMKALARHVNYRHKNPDKFECTFDGCSMKFPSRMMLDFHTNKEHNNGVPFPCDRCTRGFYRKNDLARHKIGTHKEKLQD